MELKRDQIENFSSDGLFGKLILKNENQETTLFTKEKTFNLRFKWPFGKPLDSCIISQNSFASYTIQMKYICIIYQKVFTYQVKICLPVYAGTDVY